MALVALASVTHHGGEDARTEIAEQSPLLVRIMREDPNDYKTIELAIVTLCHAVQAVLLVSDKVPDPTARSVLDHYVPGLEKWGLVVERLNEVIEGSADYEHHKPAPTTKEDKEDELAAWFNNLDLDGQTRGKMATGARTLRKI
jgi:hypothetical protein